jgi:hypothetical protein
METFEVIETEDLVAIVDGRDQDAETRNSALDREEEYLAKHPSRYRPVRARNGASASEIILLDRERF